MTFTKHIIPAIMNIMNAVPDLQFQGISYQPSEIPFQRSIEHALTFPKDTGCSNKQEAGLDEELIYFKLLIAHS